MKIILNSSLFAFLFSFSQMSIAGSFIDSASVVSVDKVYKQVRVEEPYKECYIKETIQSGDGSATNEIIGGVIGNQFGKGDGNKAATAVGAAIGAVKGSQSGQSKQIVGYQNVNQCHTEYTNSSKSVVNEYDITYLVNGTYITMRVNKAVGNNTWVGKNQRFRINYQLIN